MDALDEELQLLIQPQASVKGLPADMSDVTEFCYNQDKEHYYLHGEGALSADDIYNLQEHLFALHADEPHCKLAYDLEESIFHTYVAGSSISRHLGWDDTRIVFWYDN